MTLAAAAAPAQTALELRWELKELGMGDLLDRSAPGAGGNRPGRRGHRRGDGRPSADRSRGRILAPGRSVEFEYLTGLLGKISFAPTGPYLVFDEDPAKGPALKSYVAVPFERPSQSGRDPRVVTPEAQFAMDEGVRDIPPEALPPVFPSPLSLLRREGQLRLERMPAVEAAPELRAEADLAGPQSGSVRRVRQEPAVGGREAQRVEEGFLRASEPHAAGSREW